MIRRLLHRVRFEWRWHTRCRHFWFTPSRGSTFQLHCCEGWRGHGGLHYAGGTTDDGSSSIF